MASITGQSIRWRQVAALIALDIAILISWIAYHEFQPNLLEQFGFTDLALFLVIAQAIILFVTPPLAGHIADRIRKKRGNRLPVINIGVNIVSMIFMVVAFTIFADPQGWLRLLFPVLVSLWLISMNIFHSPAISTVEMFVPQEKLPGVMAIFAVVADSASAIEPMLQDIVRYFGAPLTFAAGGALVFLTGLIFTRATRDLTADSGKGPVEPVGDKNHLVLVLLLGLGFGLAGAWFFKGFPQFLSGNKPFWPIWDISSRALVSIMIAGAALFTYPIGLLLNDRKLHRWAVLGFVLCVLMASGTYFFVGWVSFFCACGFSLGFALLSVTFLPLAFLNLANDKVTLGIGLLFAGVELPSSLWDVGTVISAI